MQSFYEKLLRFTLRRMNIDNTAKISYNGEAFVLNYLKQNSSSNGSKKIIFDVGANVGTYIKSIGKKFGGDVEIHAFEPSAVTFKQLSENIGIQKNIKLNHFGLSNVEEEKLIYYDHEKSGLTSLYQRQLDHYGVRMNMSENIRLETLDAYCQSNNISTVFLLKIDVEGHELGVLQGAKNMLAEKKIQAIQFEFGGTNIDARTYFKDFYLLLKDNYTIYRILQNGLYEIKKYNELHEIFLYTNFLAVAR